ncbi:MULTISPECIES: 16S rRNA (uracil(1498)-N(3))-methyltransferase [unclassified Moraxella]|uniref:16S rRNA (uracil(1498)-N(3))-methyltransferase n=1 Tax=unclassified Moraxella TaxID=2685852 RepID=UPI002B40A60A|nr:MULTISPECIES: 16S rRNA (uracil(1498)-N(3))-methyltransferase [unclassified Moraxella]
MSRFFITNTPSIGEDFTLPDDVTHHWGKVLRAKKGDIATLFNGQGGEYTATLTHIDKKSAIVHIDAYVPINRTPPFSVHLGLVMSRGERMDYAIQKACEMGVSDIQLLTSERCQEHLKYERDKKKINHWQAVAVSACEQCGLNLIPKILPPISLTNFVKSCQDELKLVLAISDGQVNFSRHKDKLPQNIALLVGGEGGLTPAEIKLATEHNFYTWTIGERILRTETAPVVALAALHTIWEMTQIQ